MSGSRLFMAAAIAFLALSCSGGTDRTDESREAPQNADVQQALEGPEFPPEIVEFTPFEGNPLFAGTGEDTWDREIRERGYILHENGIWRMWYTGYNTDRGDTKYLGLATSSDGIEWTQHPGNPIFDGRWTEDMCVVKIDGTYYMAAEGKDDIAHMLTSPDGVSWTDEGDLDIRYTNGEKLSPGPYGTPTLWIENGKWYLFYERNDEAVWLAVSDDRKVWTNVQDEPVLSPGPGDYDKQAIAMNQIVKYKGRYYGWYHGTGFTPWRDWTTNVAVSTDLVTWKKYPKNPVVGEDKSSGILVPDGERWRLYTMHPDVRVYFPK